MKTIQVLTERIVSHNGDGTPIVEKTLQKLDEKKAFPNFIRFSLHLNFTLIKVINVIEVKNGKTIEFKDLVKEFQAIIDDTKSSPKGKSSAQLYKEELDRNKQLEERIKALEASLNKPDDSAKSEERIELEGMANELGIKFRESISDQKLKEKIENN